MKSNNKKTIEFEHDELNRERYTELMTWIVNQLTWRSMEHGGDLIKNQFKLIKYDFTIPNIHHVFYLSRTSVGVFILTEIFKRYEYATGCNPDSLFEQYFDKSYGILGFDQMREEMREATDFDQTKYWDYIDKHVNPDNFQSEGEWSLEQRHEDDWEMKDFLKDELIEMIKKVVNN